MHIGVAIGRVGKLSDQELLAGLQGALGSSREWMALLLAHLGEVDERRLHLLAGHPSLFAYCTDRLGMSEDEACRRIDVARLARRFPALFALLASGRVSLSVAALLKHHLTEPDHAGLLEAVSGKTVRQAREVMAAWFPRPDVPATIRKLPDRTPLNTPSASPAYTPSATQTPRRTGDTECDGEARAVEATNAASLAAAPRPAPVPMPPSAAPAVACAVSDPPAPRTPVTLGPRLASSPSASRCLDMEALSPGRFKVAFTADAELKQKLELARDLLRHAVPQGDLATIIHRALDVLIEKTEKRRFAKRDKPKSAAVSARAAGPTSDNSVQPAPPNTAPGANAEGGVGQHERAAPPPTQAERPVPSGSPPSRYLPADVRRAVLERDGQRCSYVAPDGTRCNSRAWLEHDHITPRAQGGSNDPANIRHYCRSHNRLAAEQTYGQSTIARIIARGRATRASPGSASPPNG